MKMKKLDKSVLKLWYIHAAIESLALLGIFTSAAVILNATGASGNVTLAVLIGIGIPVALLLAITLIIPALRYKMYAWGYDEKNKRYFPLYKERVNRQYLPKAFKETGSIFATKREFVTENSRLGDNIGLIEISKQESIDIDNYEDWWVAERILKKKKILITFVIMLDRI